MPSDIQSILERLHTEEDFRRAGAVFDALAVDPRATALYPGDKTQLYIEGWHLRLGAWRSGRGYAEVLRRIRPLDLRCAPQLEWYVEHAEHNVWAARLPEVGAPRPLYTCWGEHTASEESKRRVEADIKALTRGSAELEPSVNEAALKDFSVWHVFPSGGLMLTGWESLRPLRSGEGEGALKRCREMLALL